jgi:hypothetical protein
VSYRITGTDAGDFKPDSGQFEQPWVGCPSNPPNLACDLYVTFSPKSLGPKVATLEVTDNRGSRATAQLKGNGVYPICENKVVFCNYGFRYSGIFGWTIALKGPASQDSTWATVYVKNGAAVCAGGSSSISSDGQSIRGVISGKGLFAVEWLEDPMYPWVYQITAACPTPNIPASADGYRAASPSQPAELGHNDMTTYKMPDPRIKQGWTLQQAVAQLTTLQGSLRYPAPETDPLNGVSGVVTVVWNLCPKVDSIPQKSAPLGYVLRCP